MASSLVALAEEEKRATWSLECPQSLRGRGEDLLTASCQLGVVGREQLSLTGSSKGKGESGGPSWAFLQCSAHLRGITRFLH